MARDYDHLFKLLIIGDSGKFFIKFFLSNIKRKGKDSQWDDGVSLFLKQNPHNEQTVFQ